MSKYKESFEKRMGENAGFLTTHIAREYSSELLEEILRFETECFPVGWQYPDAREYYTESLKNPRVINIFLKEGKVSAGYLLALPHNDVYPILAPYDSKLRRDDSCYYLETIGVHPKFSGRGGGAKLLEMLNEEVFRRKLAERISIHARKRTNLDTLVQKKFSGNILETRHISQWHFGGDEPYEYIVWKVFGSN